MKVTRIHQYTSMVHLTDCAVINKSRNIIVINKGELNGINKDMGVISSRGIVGIIKDITNNLLDIDEKFESKIVNLSFLNISYSQC